MKLSSKQKEVIKLMREGYELMVTDIGNWVGNTYVSFWTFVVLRIRGLITKVGGNYFFFDSEHYGLTQKGRDIKID